MCTNNITMSVYDGTKSRTSAESIMDFLEGFNENSQMQSVPGLGEASERNFVEQKITTPQQLLGKYLLFIHDKATHQEVNNNFFLWVKEHNPNVNAHTITFSIAHLADKMGLLSYKD